MPQSSSYFLHGTHCSLLISAPDGGSPAIAYCGARLSNDTNADDIIRLLTRQSAQGCASIEVPATLACEPGTGYLGPPGLQVHREGQNWAPLFSITAVRHSAEKIEIDARDDAHGVAVRWRFTIDISSDVIRMETIFENMGNAPLTIDWAAVACIRTPPNLTQIINFSGRWANEFQTERAPLRQGGYISENLRGRTSHDRCPGLILCAPQTNEQSGACMGFHLGWSGNHRIRIDTLADGRRIFQAGECFWPGEMRLDPKKTYQTPSLFAQYCPHGLSAMSRNFHDYYHRALGDARIADKPRPVHFNTWEGIYFDLSLDVLRKLADAAADIGAERFVLDDGWFKARRHDHAGLGEWVVDRDVFPDGLQPLIDYVKSKNLEFGLWVEPEMVNMDSDLYRDHPDWILSAPPAPQIPFRHQFVLDLTNQAAFDNIFGQIDAILHEYPDIAYLKWDMNRDINHPGAADGTAAIHRQTNAVYALIDALREKHPHVEIESCSSGGGRADYGILARTDRIWTSDSNDALDRQMIQRGASLFFPLSVIGAHVGPRDCHITGRTLSIGLRAATAMFGHMGVEANLLTISDDDRQQLKQAIALYKEYRTHLHNGDFLRIDGPAHQNAIGVVSKDKRLGLYSYAQTATLGEVLPGILQFPGLDPVQTYQLRVIWPTTIKTPPPHWLEQSGLMADGYTARGDALMGVGLQLPVLLPQTCLVFEVKA